MEVVGEGLGVDTDTHIGPYFRQQGLPGFPGWGTRTPWAQPAANLWAVQQGLHPPLVIALGAACDPIRRVDGGPLPWGVLTRAPRCRSLAGNAHDGDCAAKNQCYYRFHGPRMITVDGGITGWTVTAASGEEREALWEWTDGVRGGVMGDQGSLGAFLKAELAAVGIDLQTPLRANRTDPRPPDVVRRRITTRRRVETVMGQRTERFHWEKIRARDRGHWTSRRARKVLAHTLCIFVNRLLGRPALPFEGLIA